MQKFLKWLEAPATSAREIFGLAGKALFLSVLWGVVMIFATWYLVRPNFPPSASLMNATGTLMSDFTEEFFFRILWLALAVMFIGRDKIIWLILLLCAGTAVWSYDHHGALAKIVSPSAAILLGFSWKGILGLIWSVVALKCATKEDLFQLKPLGICTLIHFSYNLLIVPIAGLIVS